MAEMKTIGVVLKARMLVDHLCRFEAVHSGHTHVQKHQGDVGF
jgi:hypothetical protein